MTAENIQKDYRTFVSNIEQLLAKWEQANSGFHADELRETLENRTKSDLPSGLQSTEVTTVQPIGKGIYRITSPNRSVVTGKFNSPKVGDDETGSINE